MEKRNSYTEYEDRLHRVVHYIYDHLDEEIDLNKLAHVAFMSPYHWHRIYHALQGETIAATVKRLRFHRAAGYLAHTSMPIAKVARTCGYKDVQSFTRIFKSVFGLPPGQYRKQGSHAQFQMKKKEREVGMYNIKIEKIKPQKSVSVNHTGSYMEIGKAFDTLYTQLASKNLLNSTMRSIGVYYDDPSIVPESKLRSRACMIIDKNFPVESPLEITDIAGGSYAILRHKGPYADMKSAYQWLYGEWLPKSGREVAHAPVFEEYLNSPRDTAPTELLTDIYLPLAESEK